MNMNRTIAFRLSDDFEKSRFAALFEIVMPRLSSSWKVLDNYQDADIVIYDLNASKNSELLKDFNSLSSLEVLYSDNNAAGSKWFLKKPVRASSFVEVLNKISKFFENNTQQDVIYKKIIDRHNKQDFKNTNKKNETNSQPDSKNYDNHHYKHEKFSGSPSRKFKVLSINLPDNYHSVLTSMFELARKRVREYTLIDDLKLDADIAIVDGDNLNTLKAWSIESHREKNIPTLVISKQHDFATIDGKIVLHYPWTLPKLLSALDNITIKDLKFAPELLVGGEIEGDVGSVDVNIDEQSNYFCKALVVDDSASVRKMMSLNLKLLGVNYTLVENGAEAIHSLKENVYDIVFLDIMLPDVDGIKLCKKITSSRNKNDGPSICMLTGKSSSISKMRGHMAGCDDYLTKPVNPEHLKSVLHKRFPSAGTL